MDISSLICPLCCNESFNSAEDIKLHILDILNKLVCPTCGVYLNAFENFTQHLKQCVTAKKLQLNEPCLNEMDINSQDENVNEIYIVHEDLSKEENGEEAKYYCEICDVNFVEMKKHLMDNHMGQQVVVESRDIDEILEETITLEPDKMETEIVTKSKMYNLDTEHIFLEQEILDDEGKFYTKKTTKINIIPEVERSAPVVEQMCFGCIPTHTEVENSLRVYRCQHCSSRFSELKSYNKHDCELRKGNICNICSVFFTTKTSLSQHKRKHHGENTTVFKCDFCKIEFPTEKNMTLHRKMHAPISNRRSVDPPVTYNINGNLVSDESNESFTCEVCGKEYNKKYEEVHMKSHSEEVSNCSICNRKFEDKDDLSLHLQAHGNEIEKKISCRFCKKTLSKKQTLDDHIQNHCEGRKFSCTFCGRRFLKPHEKVKHERIHTGHKPHICEICGKGFRVSYCLTLHMRTHSGVRPYQCKICSKRFKSHGAYSHHVQIHSDVRSYQCPYCSKTFKTAVQLAGHKNTHTKPFSCNICNRPFASLYAVRLHIKTHNKKNDLKHRCHVCGAEYVRITALQDHIGTHSQCSKEDSDQLTKKTMKKRVVPKSHNLMPEHKT